jgi:hypothetical protein
VELTSAKQPAAFREIQSLPLRRTAIVLAIPPVGAMALLIWQVLLGHPWGKDPMSNGNIIGWTIFLWLVYLRLLTVRLVTEVKKANLILSLRGLWRSRRIPITQIQSTEIISHNIARDYGGYGIRSTRQGKAYVAAGDRALRVTLVSGEKLIVGSQRPDELAAALR